MRSKADETLVIVFISLPNSTHKLIVRQNSYFISFSADPKHGSNGLHLREKAIYSTLLLF